jgi:hypothetical protein
MAIKSIETPGQLRSAIQRLSPASPFTDRFSKRWRALANADSHQRERKDVWYTTQHEHWLGWLKEYDGPGAYGRKGSEYSAEYAYNHIVNPQMLVYLAEAIGIADKVVRKAAKAALTNPLHDGQHVERHPARDSVGGRRSGAACTLTMTPTQKVPGAPPTSHRLKGYHGLCSKAVMTRLEPSVLIAQKSNMSATPRA